MSKNKCDISTLKSEFPESNFEPWTSEGESLMTKHGCDLITIPAKNGALEHLVGEKVNSKIFVANGYIQSVVNYDDEREKWVGELGKLHAFRKDKIVLSGQNGTGTILSIDDAGKIVKHLNKLVDTD